MKVTPQRFIEMSKALAYDPARHLQFLIEAEVVYPMPESFGNLPEIKRDPAIQELEIALKAMALSWGLRV